MGRRPAGSAADATAETKNGPLERYFAVLELVAAFPDRIGLADVAFLLDIPKTTAHRLLKGLVRARLVEGGQGGRGYRIQSRTVRLLHAAADESWLSARAQVPLEALAKQAGEACYLARLAGHRVGVALSVVPEVRWRSHVLPGLEMPPHAAASAKAILAFQEDEVVLQALAGPLRRFTDRTMVDRAQVRADFATVRQRDYAICFEEMNEGLAAIAVPVRLADGFILYSLGMTGPAQRIMDERLGERLSMLRRTATVLGETLTLAPSPPNPLPAPRKARARFPAASGNRDRPG